MKNNKYASSFTNNYAELYLLATFLKHFVSSLIRIKFERMQIHFFVWSFYCCCCLCMLLKSSQFFISDQMCPVDVLHCKTSTAKILSLYSSTVSSIHCFVIQLLSEPQKLNLCSLFKVWSTYRLIVVSGYTWHIIFNPKF